MNDEQAKREAALQSEADRLRQVIRAMRSEATGQVGAVLDMPIKTGDKDEILATLWAIAEYADDAIGAE